MTRPASPDLTEVFRRIALRIGEARLLLGELDGAIGDGDHGASMAHGFAAVARALSIAGAESGAVSEQLTLAARHFLDTVGATTGPLYASAFLAAAQRFQGLDDLPAERLPELIIAFHDGIAARGKARPRDKTMLDAWSPAARAAGQNGSPLARLAAALRAAEEGRDATGSMVATRGRAATLGERSLGHIDPGAASAVVIIAAIHETLQQYEAQ